MSQIPSHPIKPPGYGPSQFSAHTAPAQNGLAIAGFILSIVGFFTCCLTSPVGLIMSIVGMKKTDQQGLAIAGLVLGILGTLGFIGMLVYIIVVVLFLGGVAFWANEAMATASERARTMSAINIAKSEIEGYAARNHSLPSNDEGTSMIRRRRDAWNTSLRFERESGGQYQIISAGPDERFGTRDDIKRTFDASFWLSRRSWQPFDALVAVKLRRCLTVTPFAALPL